MTALSLRTTITITNKFGLLVLLVVVSGLGGCHANSFGSGNVVISGRILVSGGSITEAQVTQKKVLRFEPQDQLPLQTPIVGIVEGELRYKLYVNSIIRVSSSFPLQPTGKLTGNITLIDYTVSAPGYQTKAISIQIPQSDSQAYYVDHNHSVNVTDFERDVNLEPLGANP